jgi:glycosyltransferase involved in cell wall biosynthesis
VKVFFVQSGFENEGGHFLLETRAWRRAVEADGLQWRGFGHARLNAQTASAAGVTALFPYAPKSVIDADPLSREITDLLYFSEHFANAAVLMSEIGANDLAVIEFADAALIYGCARWLRQLPQERRPYLAVIVHVPDDAWQVDRAKNELSGPIATWRFAINQLKAVLPANKFTIAAIDARLAHFLSNILQHPVKTTPLVSWFDPNVLNDSVDASYDVLIAGGMRLDKGSDLVVAVLQALREDGAAHRISLQVDGADHARILTERIGPPGQMKIDVAVGPLSDVDYIARLSQSKVVLLPYRAEKYAVRGSGVAAEAFGYGVPIVAPANSWMSDRLGEGCGSGSAFHHFEPRHIAEAARTVLANWDAFHQSAKKAAPSWRQNNSAEVALRKIRDTLSI